jgi:hypothetical protein
MAELKKEAEGGCEWLHGYCGHPCCIGSQSIVYSNSHCANSAQATPSGFTPLLLLAGRA